MSLSAPPRCSLFVPVPGSEQLALVKRELHFLVLFQWSKSIYHRFLPLFTYMPLTSSTPPLFFFSFPSTLSYLRGISLYLQLNMSHRAQGEAWHSLSTVQSISKQAFSLRLFTAALYMPANNNTLPYWQCKRIRLICGANKGPLTVEQGPKFIIGWVINSILWIASQCPHPGTIDDIQPTWLNPISKADGWSWAHLPCNHVIAVWVNQTWIKRFVCSSWQTESWEVETMPRAESGRHQLEITAGIFLTLQPVILGGGVKNLYLLIYSSIFIILLHYFLVWSNLNSG